jgi:PKD repeat protein
MFAFNHRFAGLMRSLCSAAALSASLLSTSAHAALPVPAAGALNVPTHLDDTFDGYTLNETDANSEPYSLLSTAWMPNPSSYWRVKHDTLNTQNQNKVLGFHEFAIGTPYPHITFGNAAWQDVAVEYRFRWNGDTSVFYPFSLALRNGASGQYRLYTTEHSDNGKLYFNLVRADGSAVGPTLLNAHLVTLEQNQWYTLMLRAKGNYLQLFLDGKQVSATIQDNTASAPTAGNIGFGLPWSPKIVVDNFRIYDWSETPAILSFTNNFDDDYQVNLVRGQTLQLQWNTFSANTVTLHAGDTLLATDPSGSVEVTPQEDTTYTLAAVGAVGTDRRQVVVHVSDGAHVDSFNSSVNAVIAGTEATLSWTTTDATHVTIDGLTGIHPADGSVTVSPNETTTYTLHAVGPANSDEATVTLKAGAVNGLAFTPSVLPDLDTLGNGNVLTLDAQRTITTGDTVTNTETVIWSVSPNHVLSIDTNGVVTVLDPNYTETVAITATVHGQSQTRHIFVKTPTNLFNDPSLETGAYSWGNSVWAGSCQAARSDAQALSGDYSMQLSCAGDGRVGLFNTPATHLTPGTYRFRAHIRGLNIADSGLYGQTTDILFINDNTGTFTTDPLISGSFGWTAVEKMVHINTEADYRFYVRLFARGTLWVDDLSLVRIADAEPAAIHIGTSITDTPSACEDDAPVCPAAAPTPEQALWNLSAASVAPFAATDNHHIIDTTEGKALELTSNSGSRLDAWDHTGLQSQWTGYDYLEFEIDNRQTTFADFYLEIRDDKTVDYWSRVNWYDRLAPGVNKFRIPLQIFVGERIQVNPQRRLDLSAIRRLVLDIPSAGTYRISKLRLTEEPFKCSRPQGLQAFDFGMNGSPVMAGFREALGVTQYAACRGYGFVNNGIWSTQDRRSPDNLFRDWVSFKSDADDDFVVDVPNGEYRVHVLWEDAGYWEWYPNFQNRSIRAENLVRCDESMTYAQFLDRYYQHQDHENAPNEDTWERYIKPRFKSTCEFTVTVNDGQLSLAFNGSDPNAAAINGVVLYPTTATGAAQAWLTQLDNVRKTNYTYDYRHLDVAAASGDNDLSRVQGIHGDWVVFRRDARNPIYLNTVPAANEAIQSLAVTALRGERAALPFAVFPLTELGQVQTFSVTGLPQGIEFEAHYAMNLDARLTPDGTVYGAEPNVLNPAEGAPLAAHQSRIFWPVLTIGQSTAAGTYAANVVITTTTGQQVNLPLNVTVEPFVLPRSPIAHSVQGTLPTYLYGTFAQQLDDKAWSEAPAILELLDRYGMTAITGPALAGMNNGNCDTTQAQRFVDLLSSYAFDAEINTYASRGAASRNELSQWFHAGDTSTASNIVNCNNQFYAQNGYNLTWSLWDEPSDTASLNSMLAQDHWYRDLGATTSGYSSVHSNDPSVHTLQQQLFAQADMPYLTLFDEAAIAARHAANKPWGMYNNPTRLGYGVFGWMLAKRYGLTAITTFALNSVQSDPYYTLDSREADVAYIYTTREGYVRPTVKLEQLANGIADYRYLSALEQAIAAHPSHPAKNAAQAFLDATLNAMTLDRRDEQPSESWFQDLRVGVVQHLKTLDSAPNPVITASDLSGSEGSTLSIAASFTAASAENAVATINFGDGSATSIAAISPNNNGGTLSATHSYTANGTYQATVTVCVGTACGEKSLQINITDATPTANFVLPATTIIEGQAVQFVDASTSPADALFGWMWSFGNQGSSLEHNPSFTFTQNGSYNVCLTVVDADGSANTQCNTITVTDSAPNAAFTSPNPVFEGNLASFSDSSTGHDTLVAWQWDFAGLGNSAEQNPSFTFAQSGNYNVCLTVTDADNSTAQTCQIVAIADRAPSAGFSFPNGAIYEGNIVTFTDASISHPDAITQWSWDFGGVGSSNTQNPAFAFTQDGSYNVCLTVTDSDGSTSTGCHQVFIENTAPVIQSITAPTTPILLGNNITANVALQDSAADSHSVRYYWGDSETTDVWLAPGELSIARTHVYAEPGVYTVRVSVIDDAGAETEASYEYIVVYDPTAGRVRGKGKFVSTAGSYVTSPSWTGETRFGLEARYKNNATVPSGNLQLTLKLSKHSKAVFKETDFDWLVINQDHAWIQGSATLDGTGNYGFLVTLIDGSKASPQTPDRYRIKIWQKGTMAVVYDNEMGRDDVADPITVAEDGEIRVTIKD